MSKEFNSFIHLRVHSSYSLAEGAIKIPALIERCKDYGMPAVALTDTANLFGAMEFSTLAAKTGVQPIMGAQVAIALRKEDPRYHPLRPLNQHVFDELTLLVQTQRGYINLSKLLSQQWERAKKGDLPHITFADIEEYHHGLIALSGGLKGGLGRLLQQGKGEAADELLVALKSTFSDRLYVELTRHGVAEEQVIEEGLIDIAYKRDVPLVATNEAFFLDKEMHEAHDALLCIAEGTYISVEDRRRVTEEHRFKTLQEMQKLFSDLPEAIENTSLIAQRCSFMLETVEPKLPPYLTAKGEAAELRDQSLQGLEQRLTTQVFTDEMDESARDELRKSYSKRLDHELAVIDKMGYSGYFLIVADFIQWAKRQNIPVGPGRGSGAGSIVAWSLTITDINPIQFQLIFERFLNPERVSMPDFDIDFCQDRRDEVIEYVAGKYGQDRVAQIITFGKMQARIVIRDVGRVQQMPYGQVDRICKLIPNNPASPVSLKEAIEVEPELKQMVSEDSKVAQLVDIGKKLEGLNRHASTHAAGVVIGDRPLHEIVPLYYDSRSSMAVTQFNMKDVEKAGLVKFDFLGLRTLTALMRTVEFAKGRGVLVNFHNIPLDDAKTFALLNRCETVGIFQLESSGMIDVLRQLKPSRFEELIALVALYRPGPMDDIPRYLACKHGREAVTYMHPKLQTILEETFGVMVYQEQVMQIAQVLAGYTLGGADLLRRAMGKKIKSEMDAQRERFVEGSIKGGVAKALANKIFDQIAKFAGYGFNKSHSAPYALIAYQTAFLKANYPVEYMTALMSLELSNVDKLAIFRQEVERMEIPLLLPDINASYANFTVEELSDGKCGIRYALAAIKNVGEAAIEGIVAEREQNGRFKDIWDFAERVDISFLNRRLLEHLICAGAFDSIHGNRRQLFESIDIIVCQAQLSTKERKSKQASLFDLLAPGAMPQTKLALVEDWLFLEKLQKEFEVVGFYLSAHPVDAYIGLQDLSITKAKDVLERCTNEEGIGLNLAGIVVSKRERTSKKGQRYAFIGITDDTGNIEVMFFSEQLAQFQDVLELGRAVFIEATGRMDENRLRLTAVTTQDLEQKLANQTRQLDVSVTSVEKLARMKELLNTAGRGGCEVFLSVSHNGKKVRLRLRQKYKISPQIKMTFQQWQKDEAA